MRRQLLEDLHEYFENIAADRSEIEESLYLQLKGELPYFQITTVHRDDLESQGFDVSGVTDEQMETIARKMEGAYTGNDTYWIDLRIIAGEYAEIPLKPENWDNDELIERIQDIIDRYGAFNTTEVDAESSPCINSDGGVTILAEYFAEDCVTASTYNKDGMEIHTEFKPYTDLSKEVLCEIYLLCLNWETRND